jgi:phosphatidate cytidylyltransferase
MSNFIQRLISSTIVILVTLLAIYFSQYSYFKPVFTLLTGAIIGTALWEFYHIAKGKGFQPLSAFGIIGSIAYVYSVFLLAEMPHLETAPLIIALLMMMGGFLYYFFTGLNPLVNLSITFFGLVYLTVPLSLLITLNFEYGQAYLVYLIAVTKLTDMGAYFVGKKMGRHKMAPYISPNKTWEGALGGFIVGIIASLLMGRLVGFTTETSLVLGSVLTLASIFGDLTESLLKRDLGVKDSNHLPGLGGMLDVVDSLIFTTPLMYFYFKLFV